MALQITITNPGRAEIINAQNTGTAPVVITEIGFGSGQYDPVNKDQVALVSEIKRVSSIAGLAAADDTIHVVAKDESSDTYDVGEFGLFSASGTLIAFYSQPAVEGWIIEKSVSSTLLLAIDLILETLDAASVAFGDIGFINPPATDSVFGVVKLSTEAQLDSGAGGSIAVPPALLKPKLDAKQPLDATLSGLAALTIATNHLIYGTGPDTFGVTWFTSFARTLLDDADASTARATLGAQAADATLTALAGLATAANQLIYSTGADTFAMTALTAFARTLLDDGDAATARATLGAAPLVSPGLTGVPTAPTAAAGTNTAQIANTAFVQAAVAALVNSSPAALDTLNELAIALGNDPNFATTMTNALAAKQPLDATLSGMASLATAANQLIYATGANTFAMASLTAFARTLLDDSTAASARNTLDVPSRTGGDASGTWNINISGGAANADTVDGYHASQLWRTDQNWGSFGQPGYRRFPDGTIIQWGVTSARSYATFPVAFPNAVRTITGMWWELSTSERGVEAVGISNAGFTPRGSNNNNATSAISWCAIGY